MASSWRFGCLSWRTIAPLLLPHILTNMQYFWFGPTLKIIQTRYARYMYQQKCKFKFVLSAPLAKAIKTYIALRCHSNFLLYLKHTWALGMPKFKSRTCFGIYKKTLRKCVVSQMGRFEHHQNIVGCTLCSPPGLWTSCLRKHRNHDPTQRNIAPSLTNPSHETSIYTSPWTPIGHQMFKPNHSTYSPKLTDLAFTH